MDDLRSVHYRQNALVILAFLQTDCGSLECRNELLSLDKDLNLTWDINCNGPRIDPQVDGDLETDGHQPSCPVNDIQRSLDLHWPGNHDAAAAPQWIAGQLRIIAARLEHNVVAQATNNLQRNISSSPYEQWRNYLTQEVNSVMRQSVGLENLHQEQVIMALTLTLVKGVCEKAPGLLRNLFNTVLQYFSLTQAR